MSRPEWRVAGASVRGASHEKTGLPCQDAHKWAVVREGMLVVAVADGAGSAPMADAGAAAASAAAVEAFCQKFGDPGSPSAMDDPGWQDFLSGTLASAKSAVELAANERSVSACALASTLIVVAAGPNFVAATQVGDGAVVAAQADGRVFSITRPAQTEHLGETVFLTSAGAFATAQSTVWRGDLAHLAVLSDGLQMAALHMPAGEPHPGFFTPCFRFLAQQNDGMDVQAALASFLASSRLRECTDDDLTLVMGTLVS